MSLIPKSIVLKVIQLVPSPVRTGPVTVADDLVRVLKPYLDIQFVYFDDKEGYIWPNSQRLSLSSALSRISALECDILHSHTLRPDIFSMIRKVFFPKVKTVSTLHNYFYMEYRLEYNAIAATAGISAHHLSLKNKDALVAITPHMKKFYENKGFKNVHYIPNSRLPSPINPENEKLAARIRNWAQGDIVLMTLGSANERKNLSAVIPLLLMDSSWKWVHVGDGKLLSTLKSEVTHRKLDEKVFFTGYVPEGHHLLSAADVLLIPSLSEGFPLVILESFQQGVPVVCNRIPSFDGLFSDEVIACDVHDIKTFARSVETALLHKIQLTKMARSKYEAEFSPDAVAHAYLRLYESL